MEFDDGEVFGELGRVVNYTSNGFVSGFGTATTHAEECWWVPAVLSPKNQLGASPTDTQHTSLNVQATAIQCY